MGAVVELQEIVVEYGKFRALDGLSVSIPAGATGLVGRNGAGKSTVLRLALGLLRPTSGRGMVLGQDVVRPTLARRELLGFMPEGDALVPGLHGLEQVVLAGELCGLPPRQAARRAHEVLAFVGMGEARYRPVEQYSTGMRQRLKLAIALVHDPPMLLLDEPTVGLDPPGRQRMLELIRELARQHGKSVLLSTHLLDDIQDTCTYVVMIERGRVLVCGEPDALAVGSRVCYRLTWEGAGDFSHALHQVGLQLLADDEPNQPLARAQRPRARVSVDANFDERQFFHLAHQQGVLLRSLEREHEDLGDAYHRLLENASHGA